MDISLIAYFIYIFLFAFLYSVVNYAYFFLNSRFYIKSLARIQNKDASDLRPFKLWPNGTHPHFLIALSLWYFVIHDIVSGNENRIFFIVMRSTLMALAVKGTANFHNYYTFDYYPTKNALIDTMWWVVSFNIVALSMYGLRRRMSCRQSQNNEP